MNGVLFGFVAAAISGALVGFAVGVAL